MYKILVADDEPIERAVICRLVSKHYENQFEVVQASNGREAVENFEKNNCDIAMLDIEMPGVNGLVAAENIRSKNKNACIIFLTAFDDFAFAKKAIQVKALEYILKPAMEDEVVAALDEAIRILEENTQKENHIIRDMEESYDFSDNYEMDEGVRITAARKLILEFIQNNYMYDISLQDAAKAMKYSDAYFCKLFKNCFDVNFIVFLSKYRVDKAKELLDDITINVKDISEKVGYRDSNYFSKVFKRIEGVTPTEYRNRLLEIK